MPCASWGRVAAREAVRLKAKRVAWAPVIRDQGNSKIDVGEGDRAFVESVLSAYDTEQRLQAQGLAEKFEITEWVIEAGPSYFDGSVEQIGKGIAATLPELARRDAAHLQHALPVTPCAGRLHCWTIPLALATGAELDAAAAPTGLSAAALQRRLLVSSRPNAAHGSV